MLPLANLTPKTARDAVWDATSPQSTAPRATQGDPPHARSTTVDRGVVHVSARPLVAATVLPAARVRAATYAHVRGSDRRGGRRLCPRSCVGAIMGARFDGAARISRGTLMTWRTCAGVRVRRATQRARARRVGAPCAERGRTRAKHALHYQRVYVVRRARAGECGGRGSRKPLDARPRGRHICDGDVAGGGRAGAAAAAAAHEGARAHDVTRPACMGARAHGNCSTTLIAAALAAWDYAV